MPELPEVETVARGLRETIVGRTIAAVSLRRPDLLQTDPVLFSAGLMGRTVAGVRRRGKYLLIDLRSPPPAEEAFTLIVHLGMTGQLLVLPAEAPVRPHTHLFVDFADGEGQLRFRDPRRFGFLALRPSDRVEQEPPLVHLGPEPLAMSGAEFQEVMGSRRGRIKALLLNQRVIAGVGNIYADEILFAARIHPQQPAQSLGKVRQQRLFEALQRILRAAVVSRGSTIDDYVLIDGGPGGYQDFHQVYGRAGQPCPYCGTAIRCIRVSGRSTHFCPRCQRRR